MKIVHHKFGADSILQTAYSRSGDCRATLRGQGAEVCASSFVPHERSYQPFAQDSSRGAYGYSRIALRTFVRGVTGGTPNYDDELLYAKVVSGTIERRDVNGEQPPLELTIDPTCISTLRASLDGRFVAAGNEAGQFEIWQVDGKPRRAFSFGFAQQGTIQDLCFSTGNLFLYASMDDAVYRFDYNHDSVVQLTTDANWRCYSMDVHGPNNDRDGDAIVFGGEDDVVWFLNLRANFFDKHVNHHDNPFRMSDQVTVGGDAFKEVYAMPEAAVGCIKTNVGSYVKQVRFLAEGLVCVLGPRATEVWRIEHGSAECVARRAHDDDDLVPVSFGGNEERVIVSLARQS